LGKPTEKERGFIADLLTSLSTAREVTWEGSTNQLQVVVFATDGRSARAVIVALVVGIVLVSLGAGTIYSAYQRHQQMLVGYEGLYSWE